MVLAALLLADVTVAVIHAGRRGPGPLVIAAAVLGVTLTVQHRSALAAGFAVLPLFLPLVVLAPVSGRITARLGPKLPMAAGLLVAAGGVTLLAGLSAASGYLVLLPALLAWGVEGSEIEEIIQ
jgi:DHA2 family methylenomycin A resistance protein-like MFS transporter